MSNNDDKTLFENLDDTQIAFMNEDMVILVDESDKNIGKCSKKESHLNTRIEDPENPLLHRAFSVLLFDNENRLLLQKRASDKITFGDYWTNTCCSHPLFDQKEDETDETNNHIGVRRAAVRKLDHELGIKPSEELLNALKPLTRVRYGARSNDTWGENEIDYILLCKLDSQPEMKVNLNEASDTKYVTREEMKQMLQDDGKDGLKITPWFRLLCDNFLFGWWDQLDQLPEFEQKIHNFFEKKSE